MSSVRRRGTGLSDKDEKAAKTARSRVAAGTTLRPPALKTSKVRPTVPRVTSKRSTSPILSKAKTPTVTARRPSATKSTLSKTSSTKKSKSTLSSTKPTTLRSSNSAPTVRNGAAKKSLTKRATTGSLTPKSVASPTKSPSSSSSSEGNSSSGNGGGGLKTVPLFQVEVQFTTLISVIKSQEEMLLDAEHQKKELRRKLEDREDEMEIVLERLRTAEEALQDAVGGTGKSSRKTSFSDDDRVNALVSGTSKPKSPRDSLLIAGWQTDVSDTGAMNAKTKAKRSASWKKVSDEDMSKEVDKSRLKNAERRIRELEKELAVAQERLKRAVGSQSKGGSPAKYTGVALDDTVVIGHKLQESELRVKELAALVEIREKQISVVEQQLREQEVLLGLYDKDKRELGSKVDDFRGKLKTISSSSGAKDRKVEEMHEELRELSERLKQSEAEIEERGKELSKRDSVIVQLRREVESHAVRLSKRDSRGDGSGSVSPTVFEPAEDGLETHSESDGKKKKKKRFGLFKSKKK